MSLENPLLAQETRAYQLSIQVHSIRDLNLYLIIFYEVKDQAPRPLTFVTLSNEDLESRR